MGVGYNPKIVTDGLVLALDAGNTKSFPIGLSYSNLFDGTNDNLTTASSAAFNFGTGDFTVEVWFYPTALGRQHSLVDLRSTGTNGWVFYINSSNRLQYWDGSSTTSSTSTVSINTWSHLVWCRSGSTLKAFINGVEAFSTTNSKNNNTDVPACIGSSFDAQGYSLGYLSNVRVVKGTALYTSNFTVPTVPLTAITNTSLLTCQSSTFIDNSTNNFTITRNGDVSIQTLSPSGATLADLSGNSQTFTLYNYPPFSSLYSGEIKFSYSNDYARIRNTSVAGSIGLNGTFELWFRTLNSTLQTSGNYGRLVSVSNEGGTGSDTSSTQGGNNDYSNYFCLAHNNTAQTLGFWYKAGFSGPNPFTPSTTINVNNNNYWHVAVSWQTSGSQMIFNFYVNGVLVGGPSTYNVTGFTDATTITLGQNCMGALTNPMENTDIAIGSFKCYNRTLTAAEIRQNFNAQRGRYGI